MRTKAERTRVTIAAFTGAVMVVLLAAVACTQSQTVVVPTQVPAATVAAEPTATPIPTSTPAPTATPLPPTAVPATNTPAPTSTPVPTSTPAPTATAVPTAQSVSASPTPEPTVQAAATEAPDATSPRAADAAPECPTPEQAEYMDTVGDYFTSFTAIMGNVAADWFLLQDDINLLFGDDFKNGGKESVMQLRELAAEMRAGEAPESMSEFEALLGEIADKSEGYAASLEPLYDLTPGTPGIDLLLGLALEASATEIQQISAIGMNLDSLRRDLCG